MVNRREVYISAGCIIFLTILSICSGQESVASLAFFPILYVGCMKGTADISDIQDIVNGNALRIKYIQENLKQHVEIEFNVEVQSKVRLSVYDMYGKLVKNLLNDEFKEGKHYLIWKSGSHITNSGPFYFKMESGNVVEVKKLFYS
jgi:hypothetical protein